VTAVTVLIAPGVNAAMAGFALAFANSISHSLLFVVRRFVQLEQSMVALERIKEYSELPREAAEFVEPRPSASWPHNGGISVEKLEIRYAVSVNLSPRIPSS
jgi:ABC-type multidrug transport system fused ATPase/permease subunit